MSDIRCHCNQPACVRTGYMCKSTGPQAACFVEHSNFVNAGRSSSDISRHGCIEMLPIGQRTPCLTQALDVFASQNAGYAVPQRTGAHHHGTGHRHLLDGGRHHGHRSADHQQKSTTCCLDDMCNYVKTNIREEEAAVAGVDRNEPPKVEVTSQWNPSRAVGSGSSTAKTDNMDSLGKHFEESYRDPNKHDGTLWFEVLIFGIIMVLLAVLVLLILFGVRFIRQGDCQHQKSSQSNLPQTRLPNTYGYDLGDEHCNPSGNGSGKRSMLDQWKCFKSVTSANAHQLMGANNRAVGGGVGGQTSSSSLLYGGSKPSTGSLLYSSQAKCQTSKQSLLFSVKVDLDSSQQCPPPMTTKLSSDDLSGSEIGSQITTANASNLPNIICEHTLPPEKMAQHVQQSAGDEQLESSRSSAVNRAAGFGRERQNSIYLSLLPPTTTTSVIQPS
ncbi:hypothetical protein TYRP_006594 [Tyrophagus putrescentiae]|nr:hypothetical protein TYRP_006594 [Tyrophagus putrescentiae]